MPHSAKGKPVAIGDKIIELHRYEGKVIQVSAGTVVSITDGTTCNAQVVPFNTPTIYVTLGNSFHVDDLPDFKE